MICSFTKIFLPCQLARKLCISFFSTLFSLSFFMWLVSAYAGKLNFKSGFGKCILSLNPAGSYVFKVNNRNYRTSCEVCSELTIKAPERRQWRRSGVFIVNFKHISHLVLVFLLITLSRYMPAGYMLLGKRRRSEWLIHLLFWTWKRTDRSLLSIIDVYHIFQVL